MGGFYVHAFSRLSTMNMNNFYNQEKIKEVCFQTDGDLGFVVVVVWFVCFLGFLFLFLVLVVFLLLLF